MKLVDGTEIVTPADDPAQFAPDWRASVAGYVFSRQVWTPDEYRMLAEKGEIIVKGEEESILDSYEDITPREPKTKSKSKKGRKKSADKEPIAKKKDTRPRAVLAPFDDPACRILLNDVFIQAQWAFLVADTRGDALTPDQELMRLAQRWYGEQRPNNARSRLEPLLLTDVGFDTISLDLLGSIKYVDAIRFYERLYFNCRIDDGSLNQSVQLRQWFALPNGDIKMYYRDSELDDDGDPLPGAQPLTTTAEIWKAIANSMGYDTLMYTWMWQDHAHGMTQRSADFMIEQTWKAAQARLFTDVMEGRVGHESMAKILAAFTSQHKLLLDRKSSGDIAGDIVEAFTGLLSKTAPHMVDVSKDRAALEMQRKEIEAKVGGSAALIGKGSAAVATSKKGV